MRKLRVVFTTVGGAIPTLVATIVASPAIDACGSEREDGFEDARDDAGDGASTKDTNPFSPMPDVMTFDVDPRICASSGVSQSHVVEIPPPGVPAEPGQLCAVPQATTSSNTSARVTLTSYSPSQETASGFIAVPASIADSITTTLPTVSVISATSPAFAAMNVTGMTKVAGGYQFQASWPSPLPHNAYGGAQMSVKTTFDIACEGGTKTVESLTKIDFCADVDNSFAWVSSGDVCTVCEVIAEMAPSPIVSDKKGDDLPLGTVIRLRVVEVARAGNQILLFADNDAGAEAEYEWRVSIGSLEQVADDVMLWSLPDAAAGATKPPFGQVGVWNGSGAAVENFISSVSWSAAAAS